MNIQELLHQALDLNASDVFIIAGLPVSYRINGNVEITETDKLTPADTEAFITQIYTDAKRSMDHFKATGDDDFSLSIHGFSRFRVNTFLQRGSCSAVIRIIRFELPDPKKLGIPDSIMNLADLTKGMVLVTGPAGSGKSTTLACIIDRINHTRACHIITLEDPIEFLHTHQKSIVSQREIAHDTESYVTALRATLRQSPDIIQLGEMRDYETISVAMTAAETGHLLFSTLHTSGAANTINRIIDVFPANQQRQIIVQLSTVLTAVVSQQLIPAIDGSLVLAYEVMTVTPAIRNLIRDNKVYQIDGMIYSSSGPDIISMDNCLLNLYNNGRITKDTAIAYATNPDMLNRKLH
ncbi:MAG: PilT/PilU family type 4a pilus ATPase [Solobacterium sp.]|jgi:twitching motility protein PilT|nr:PilT/PilU family type 4a pilus ATPase [Solobacterium sp.]MCH4048701.1 PilT/PilU family type 4a pilus ATPase [Solobacterium sp.]MCH4075608.1 PilT/PilU family type 4a pilus ATPase [Solobacterium sp.]MCI1313715.1 PilT/PilU family type 4a pilus ATPase [Solobacterium sp.]MCI1345875.1 PilT/PilU family type 4a pilus ATPase [Solobacterium sp.]